MHLQGITLQRALELQQAFANDATHEVAAPLYALACAALVMQDDGSVVCCCQASTSYADVFLPDLS